MRARTLSLKVFVALSLGAVLLVPAATAQEEPGATYFVVDPDTGGRGRWSSLAANQITGHVAVAYFYATNTAFELRFAEFDGATWTAPLTLATGSGYDVYADLASFHNAADDVAIAYYDGNDLWLIERHSGTWGAPVPVDAANIRGAFCSIVILPTGLPMISYVDVTNGNLRVGWRPTPTTWTRRDIDTVDPQGFTSLALFNDGTADYPGVAYRGSGGALKFAWNPTTDYTTGWNLKTVTGVAAGHITLTPRPPTAATPTWQTPFITYYTDAGELWYGWNDGPMADWGSSAQWKLRRIDVGAGTYNAAAFSRSELPILSYYDAAAGLVTATSLTPYSIFPNWLIAPVDGPAPLGRYTSLAVLPNGLTAISYFGSGVLKCAVEKPQACCWPDGSCSDEPALDCGTWGGLPGGVDTTCATFTCPPPGACCQPDGSCAVTLEVLCTGTWVGDNTACEPLNPCSLITGACCLSEGCSELNEYYCAEAEGTYIGDNTTCEPLDPCSSITGACCVGDVCSELNEYYCADAGGTYIGDGTACTPLDPCSPITGACCVGDTCSELNEYYCADAGGTYIGDGTACTPLDPCSPITGACCVGDTCSELNEYYCADAGGTYIGDGTTCTPLDPCSTVTGACCVGDTCSELNEYYCADAGGTYIGDSTTCTPLDPCSTVTGACCVGDTCSELNEYYCADAGGTYIGDGTACTPLDPCSSITGACCNAGACVEQNAYYCADNGGIYLGDGVACDIDLCPLPGQVACCRLDGSCYHATPQQCIENSFFAQGPGSVCYLTDCYRGACCWPDGSCTVLTPAECATGNYLGDFVACDPNPCVQNDFCAYAVPIYDGTTGFSTLNATTDGPAHPEACTTAGDGGQTFHDIWFTYVATQSGHLVVSTCGTAAYDTDLVIYDGCECTELVRLACNDNWPGCPGNTSILHAPVAAGQCYLLRVGGWNDGNMGVGNVSIGYPPANCAGDADCDGNVNWRDIDYFVAAMNDDVAAWFALFAPAGPTCMYLNNDVNGDGTVNWRDIDALVAVMNTVCP